MEEKAPESGCVMALAGVGVVIFLIGFYIVPKPAGWWVVGASFIFDIPLVLGLVIAGLSGKDAKQDRSADSLDSHK